MPSLSAVTLAVAEIAVELTVKSPLTATAPEMLRLSRPVPVLIVKSTLLCALLVSLTMTLSLPSVPPVTVSRTTSSLSKKATVSNVVPALLPETRMACSPLTNAVPSATVSTSAEPGNCNVAVTMPVMSTGSRPVKVIVSPATATLPLPVVDAWGVYVPSVLVPLPITRSASVVPAPPLYPMLLPNAPFEKLIASTSLPSPVFTRIWLPVTAEKGTSIV